MSRGRPPGSKNKRPSTIAIGNSLAARGVDLAERLLKLADDVMQDGSIRLKALELLCKYSQIVPTAETESESDAEQDPEIRSMSTEELLNRVSGSPQ